MLTGALWVLSSAVVGSVIIPPVAKFFSSKVKLFVKTKKLSLRQAVLSRLKDEATRKMIEEMIISAEKKLGSKTGRAKFELVKASVLKVIPDMFDPLVSAVIQAVYDGLVEEGEI